MKAREYINTGGREPDEREVAMLEALMRRAGWTGAPYTLEPAKDVQGTPWVAEFPIGDRQARLLPSPHGGGRRCPKGG
jgi:hypothetical protein